MSRSKKLFGGMMAVLAFTVGLTTHLIWSGVVLPSISGDSSFSEPENAQDCDIYAEKPTVNYTDRIIYSSGTRGSACTAARSVTVYLKQDRRFWFDKKLASNSGSGTNFVVTVSYACKGTGHQRVYTEVTSGNRKVQSSRISANYCS